MTLGCQKLLFLQLFLVLGLKLVGASILHGNLVFLDQIEMEISRGFARKVRGREVFEWYRSHQVFLFLKLHISRFETRGYCNIYHSMLYLYYNFSILNWTSVVHFFSTDIMCVSGCGSGSNKIYSMANVAFLNRFDTIPACWNQSIIVSERAKRARHYQG